MRDGLDFVESYEDDRVSDVIEMLFGDGQADMAHFAADRPLAAPPGNTVLLLVGHVEHHLGHRRPRRRARRGLRPLLAQPAVRGHRHDQCRARVRRGGHLGRLVLPARNGPRLRALRAALPARRIVGGHPPVAGGLGGLRPHVGVGGPRGRQSLWCALVGRGGRHPRHVPRLLATRASRSPSAPRWT